MKKLITITLALIMMLALAFSAMAADTLTPAPDDDWTDEQWDAYFREYRESQMRAIGLVYDTNVMLRDTVFTFSGTGPETANGRIMVTAETAAENLSAKLTMSGNTAVLEFDGVSLVFTEGSDSVEVIGGGEAKKIALDCAPYIKDGSLFIPIRFAAEALGYDVYWDSYYSTAVIFDKDNIIAELNSEYSLLNGVLKMSSGFTGSTIGADISASMELTQFDTIKGDSTYAVSFNATVICDGKSINATLRADLRAISSFLAKNLDDDYFQEKSGLLDSIFNALNVSGAEIIIDTDGDMLYMRSPALSLALSEYGAELPSGSWLSMEIDSSEFENIFFYFDGFSEFESGGSFGELLYESFVTGSYYPATAYKSMTENSVEFNDDRFTAIPGGYSCDIDLGEYGYENGSVNLRIYTDVNGVYRVTGSFSAYEESYTATLLEAEFSITSSKLTLSGVYHIKNQMKTDYSLSVTLKGTPATVQGQPPASDNICSIDSLL